MSNSYRYLLIFIGSLIGSAIICNYKGDAWEKHVRQTLYFIKNDSVTNYAAERVDNRGVPYIFYLEQNGINPGTQYNSTIVCNYAIDYYQQYKKSADPSLKNKFDNCISWLMNNMTYRDSAAIFEFKWKQPWYPSVGVPYTSGMTSGRAMEAFVYAHELSGSDIPLQQAKSILRGFFIPINEGGFTYKTKDGWWYEEIADSNMQTPRILDGHIFALSGVHKYWLATKDDSARYVVQQGLLSLKKNLNLYDAGNGWSYYDINKKRSDKKYHGILTDQMKELYEISKDKFFLDYYNKWNAYFNKAYLLRITEERNMSGIVLFVCVAILLSIILMLITRFILLRK